MFALATCESTATIFIGIILGVAAHQLIFIHGEWHLYAPTMVSVHTIAACLMMVVDVWTTSGTSSGPLKATAVLTSYLASMLASISIYRLSFHRIRHFPGPKLAAVSKLWHVWQCRDSRNHLVLEALYREFGSFVRTGPCEITVFHPAAFESMDGPKSNTTRSDWYDLLYPRVSSVFTRDKRLHEDRRRIWSHSLNTKALADYEPRILRKVMRLMKWIEKSESKPIVINDLMRWFSFDLMGDIAFSEDFGMMDKNKYNLAITQLRSAITLLGPFSPAIWIPRLGFAFIPGLWKVKDWFSMLRFCDGCMEQRMKMTVAEPDIASFFIKKVDRDSKNPDQQRWLSGDTATIVVAGSDTTAPTLTNLLFLLARNPESVKKIQAEVDSVDIQSVNAVATLCHLNGAINESMRLYPAVPTAVTRVSPPEGMELGGTFIPGNVKIVAPRWSIGRLDSAWQAPHEFCPERWYSRLDMIRDRRAFAPFGVGKTSCVGKNLALTEIRLVIASLLSLFDINFLPGDDGAALERDMRDQLTANPGVLRLIFTRRSCENMTVGTQNLL